MHEAASFADTPFPKVVERLVGAGVKSYTADLVKLRNTYYGSGGEAYDEALPLTGRPGDRAGIRFFRRRRVGQSHPARRDRLR